MPIHHALRCAVLAASLLPWPGAAWSGANALFANGFEGGFVPNGSIYIIPFAVEDGPCPPTMTPGAARSTITVEPGTLVQQCFLVVNESTDTLQSHRVENTTLGIELLSSQPVQPYSWIVLAQPGGPLPVTERVIHWMRWTTFVGDSSYSYEATMNLAASPALEVYHLLSTDPAACPAGVLPESVQVNGHRRLTVAPGTLVHHCIQGRNVGFGIEHQLGEHRLQGTVFPTTYEDASLIANGRILSVPVATAAPAMGEHAYQTTWSASAETSPTTVEETDGASLRVVADPACAGIETGTTTDYGLAIPGLYFSLGVRIDYQLAATPARAGEAIALEAHGAITALGADGLGARADTRVVLALPAAIDLQRPISVAASIDGGTPISAQVDLDTGTLVLSTGPVSGTPAELDVSVEAFLTASPSLPIVLPAAQLELDLIDRDGDISTLAIQPDPAGPPILELPLCPPQ